MPRGKSQWLSNACSGANLGYNGDMAESLKSKRVKFIKTGDQGRFLLNAKNELDLSHDQFSRKLGVCSRTLRDWEKEKFNMSLGAVNFICKKLKIKIPKNIEILDNYWYVVKGAKKGGINNYKKYGVVGGDQKIRKEKWQEWWDKEGKFNKHSVIGKRMPIKKPRRSAELAEFVGIVLGDGGISEMQVTITLHRITDREYSFFVRKLIKKLFGVVPGEYCNLSALADSIVVSRKELVEFCVQGLGLKVGNKIKNQVDIPDWIKNNKKYFIACVRGLVDTDGSIYNHKYISGGKKYSYKKISFTSLSKPLARSVYAFLKENNINPGLYKEKDVKLESQADVARYFSIFGSHNPKHLKRYKN